MPRSLFNTETESAYLKAKPTERRDLGIAQLERVPLEAHSEAAPHTGRTDPLVILAAQDESRLADLIPLRYGRMSRTPFTFLRGAAAVMASDLAAGARTNLWVELCGDAHLVGQVESSVTLSRATSIVGKAQSAGNGRPFPRAATPPTMLVARLSVTELSTWPTRLSESHTHCETAAGNKV